MAIAGNTIAHENLVDQNAIDWRRLIQRMLQGYEFVAAGGTGGGGVARSGDCAVSQRGAGANMSVDVAVGGVMAGVQSGATGYSANGGTWFGFNDAVLNVPIAGSDPVSARTDRVGFGVKDAAFAGATNDGQITVITGTPGAGTPAIPATYIAWVDLAFVAVAALAASITNANVTDKRWRLSALGGITVCTSSATYPTAGLWDGQFVWDVALRSIMQYDLATTTWKRTGDQIPHTSLTSFTPGGTRTTASAAYADWNAGDAGRDVSITKHRLDTKLVLEVFTSRCFNTTLATQQIAVSVNGTDYQCTSNTPGATVEEEQSGWNEVAAGALAAGTYTCRLRVKTSAGTFTYGDATSRCGLKVTESL